MGFMVVGNPAATVITSSSVNLLGPNFGDVNADKASRFADEPELVSRQ